MTQTLNKENLKDIFSYMEQQKNITDLVAEMRKFISEHTRGTVNVRSIELINFQGEIIKFENLISI